MSTSIAIDNRANPKAFQSFLDRSVLALPMVLVAEANVQAKRDTIGKLPFAKGTIPATLRD